MSTGKRLGRGLGALLGQFGGGDDVPELRLRSAESETDAQNGDAKSQGTKIDITKIVPNPFQPRKVFDETELEQLAQSLVTHGLLSPIAVRNVEDGYQIIAGERRYRAALRAGWSEVAAIVYEADDRQMAELALTENLQRKDLNALEKANSFAQYLEVYGGTHEELAKRLEIARPTVSNLLRLLQLPQKLQEAVCEERISANHARTLLPLAEFEQIQIADKIHAEGWSVRETERFVQELVKTGEAEFPQGRQPTVTSGSQTASGTPQTAEGGTGGWHIVDTDGKPRIVRRKSSRSEQVKQLEEDFRRCLGGAKVELMQTNDHGKGKLIVSFANHAEFDRLYAAVCQSSRAAG